MTTSDSLCTDVPPSQKKSGEESRLPRRGSVCTQARQVTIILRFITAICNIVVFSFSNMHQFLCSQVNTLVRVVKNLLKTNFYEARIFTKGIKLLQVVYIFLSLYEVYRLGFLKPGH